MNAKPKRYAGDEVRLKEIPGEHLVIECEVFEPRSAVGRTVYVWFDAEEGAALLRLVREQQILARSKTMTAAPGGEG